MQYKTGNSVKAPVKPSCVSTVLIKFPERSAIARDPSYFYACQGRLIPTNVVLRSSHDDLMVFLLLIHWTLTMFPLPSRCMTRYHGVPTALVAR